MTRWPVQDKAAVTAAVALTVSCLLGFVLVYVLTVRTTPGRQFGDASLRGAVVTNSRVFNGVDAVLGVVSVATLLGGVAAIALIALVRLRRVPGITAVGVLVAANASTWLLKTQVLTRPDLGLREITPAMHNSLPSGHTTAVFSVVVALLIVVPARGRRPIAFIGGAAAAVTALATMSAGWHRAGDSIAAFLVVGMCAGVAAIVIVLSAGNTTRVRVPPPRASDGPRPRWMIASTVGSAGVAFCLALLLVLVRPLRTSTAGAVAAFVASGVLIVAAAITVLTAELLVLERSDR